MFAWSAWSALPARNCLLFVFLFAVEAATGQYKIKEYVQGNTV
jgi:hypothetical protein